MSKIVQNIHKINAIDGTPDANKPVSLLQQMAIDEKVNLTDFNNFKNEVEALLVSNDLTLDELQEIVDFIKLNRADLDNLGISSISGLQTALDKKICCLLKKFESEHCLKSLGE